jgi:SAM-dependent methyltransferase
MTAATNGTELLTGLRILREGETEKEILAAAIREMAHPDRPIRVLEAGCGQRWPIALDGVELHITGVDTDEEAMRIRRDTNGDLDVEIVGDLRTVDLPPSAFDVVYCSYVLEHVDGAEVVLDRLVAATSPGGRIIIRIPDGKTVYGFLVRHSPHRAHVLYKRYIEGFKDAGKPGHAPYPTIYDPVVSLPGMRDYVNGHGLRVVQAWGSNAWVKNFGPAAKLVALATRAAAAVTRGRLRGTHANLGLVFERV